MEHIFQLTTSPKFIQTMHSFGLVALFLAIGVAVVGLVYYGRAREGDGKIDQWTLLFATWRDSLIVTLLYTSQSFLWHFSAFSGLSQVIPETPFLYAPLVQPILALIADVLIFVIIVLRVIVLTRWLSSREGT